MVEKSERLCTQRQASGREEGIRLDVETPRELDAVGEHCTAVDADHETARSRREADGVGHANQRPARRQHLRQIAYEVGVEQVERVVVRIVNGDLETRRSERRIAFVVDQNA